MADMVLPSLFERMLAFAAAWEPCRAKMLESIAETNGTHTEDDVIAMILGGKLKLWARGESAMITEFVEYPRLRALNVFLGAGDKDVLFDMEKDLVTFAAENGCKRITGGGRLGWTKSLPGYVVGGTFMHKDI